MPQVIGDPVGKSFYTTVRRIEGAAKGLPRVGCSGQASEDPVLFGQEASLSFAASTLNRCEPATQRRSKARLVVNFFGLLGPNGPMPSHITEYVRDRKMNHDDPTLVRFLDIFNHRMISLFYRAWATNRPTVSFDRDDDPFGFYVGSFCGLGFRSLRERDAVPDLGKLHFSGHLACQTRHAEGLRSLLQDFFRMRVVIHQFVGQWMDIPDEYRCRLGESPETCALGTTAMVGSQIWECQQKFRIVMGPMPLRDYERLLPGGQSFKRLRDWVKNYDCDEHCWDLQLVLEAKEVPQVRLGSFGRLGWTSWVRSREVEKDADDLVLRSAPA